MDSTSSFPSSGTLKVTTSNGYLSQIVTYTGKTDTSFTGCSGGVGTMTTNNLITNYVVITVAATSSFPTTGFLQIVTSAGVRVG